MIANFIGSLVHFNGKLNLIDKYIDSIANPFKIEAGYFTVPTKNEYNKNTGK